MRVGILGSGLMRAECGEVDFKLAYDPDAQRDRCELLKDIVAIGNHGGGARFIGLACASRMGHRRV